jgi:diguanylate cyclase
MLFGHRLNLAFVLLLAAFSFAGASSQAAPGSTNPQASDNTIVSAVGVLADPSGTMTIAQAATASYRPIALNGEMGSSSSIYWIRMTVRRRGDPATSWILDFTRGWDLIDFYFPSGQGFNHFVAGDRVSPLYRPIRSHRSAILLPIPEDRELTFYVRLNGDPTLYEMPRRLDFHFERTENFIAETRAFIYLQGIYAGVMLAMALYNLVLFAGLRERAYLYYSLYVLSFGLLWSPRAAFLSEYIWPNSTQWESASTIYFCGFAVFFSAAFVRSFLGTKQSWKAGDLALKITLAVTFLTVLAGVLFSTEHVAPVLAWEALAASLLYAVLAFTMLRRGFAPARLFLLAWTVLTATNVCFILAFLGILHISVESAESAVQVGSAVECMLLALALVDRVRAMKAESEARQSRQTAELENAVEQRTRELVDLNQRLETASITDPLTGLGNRRYVDLMMGRMTAEIRRNHSSGGGDLLLICIADLDHFKNINDEFGHEQGDVVLRAVSNLLSKSVRGSTVVARWGGEEFLFIEPVRNTKEGTVMAERLRQRVANNPHVLSPQQTAQITVSMGVAHFPFSHAYPEILGWLEVLTIADYGLYKAKQSGRNRWFILVANEEKLAQQVAQKGLQQAAELLHLRIAEAIELGIVEFTTIDAPQPEPA